MSRLVQLKTQRSSGKLNAGYEIKKSKIMIEDDKLAIIGFLYTFRKAVIYNSTVVKSLDMDMAAYEAATNLLVEDKLINITMHEISISTKGILWYEEKTGQPKLENEENPEFEKKSFTITKKLLLLTVIIAIVAIAITLLFVFQVI